MKKNVSLIVGGSKGIGYSIFKSFISSGQDTYILSRKIKKSKRYINIDLSNKDFIQRLVKNVFFKKIKIQNLIFCQRFRGENIYDHFQVSLFSVVNFLEKINKLMKKNSSVIVINSIASNFIVSEQPLGYHTSKASLENLVKYYAVKYGHQQIRFNSISPGTIIKEESKKFFKNSKKYKFISEKVIPLKRLGTSKDVVNLVEFLCSKKASYITGQNIYLDGGLSLVGQESLARKIISKGK